MHEARVRRRHAHRWYWFGGVDGYEVRSWGVHSLSATLVTALSPSQPLSVARSHSRYSSQSLSRSHAQYTLARQGATGVGWVAGGGPSKSAVVPARPSSSARDRVTIARVLSLDRWVSCIGWHEDKLLARPVVSYQLVT